MAASNVKSRPPTTPILAKCLLVSYLPISTFPPIHWVISKIKIPLATACCKLSTNQASVQVLPAPTPSRIIAFTPSALITACTYAGEIPGNIFNNEI